ncbi:MAG: hypothetical protein EKK55_07075 [Rhodocyclaceae bacterium]|nr:MAG: hypothetical protein EKK55_07075 [Rhodocyclaceae bacterium]
MTRIRFVAPGRCLERQPFEPGEVLRTPRLARQPTPLLGYHLACPSCGARRIELADTGAPFVEGTPLEVTATVAVRAGGERAVRFWVPASLASERPIACGACHIVYRLSGEVFVVG